jgi:undecaprenyl-diphosphatase
MNLEYFYVLILGLVEGLTEFLPVSSTGHLILTSHLLNLPAEKYNSINIIIQLGAILAVIFLYPTRFKKLLTFNALKFQRDPKELNLWHIFFAIMPALILGFFARHFIKNVLMTPTTVTVSLIVVGIFMIIGERLKPKVKVESIDAISYKDSLIIGIGQTFSLIPGVSRSGATILFSMGRGIDLKTSADFSFFISVPIITLATLYELLKSYHLFSSNDLGLLMFGLAISFGVAILGIKFFLKVLKHFSLTPFAIYRIILGIIFYGLILR